MTNIQIIENNVKIAKFLKWKKHETFSYITPFYKPYLNVSGSISETSLFSTQELKFHKSWDWLMLAIEEINNTETPNDKYESGERIYVESTYPRTFGLKNQENGYYMFRFNGCTLWEAEKLIDAAYLAVIDFIDNSTFSENNKNNLKNKNNENNF